MDNELSDPSDWLNTSLPPFSALENSLRCQVCKDFYTTPMVTTCSHTFCSICIRRCLSVDGKCPACRANDQASKLRRNWALEEVVGAFKTARPVALEIATKDKKEKEEAPSRPNKRRRTERNSGGSDLTVRTTRSKSKRTQQADQQPATLDGADDDGSDAEWTENGGTQPERAQTPDDGAPRTKRELLDELRKWDRSIGREPDQFGTSNQVMKKDFDAKAWSSGNKDDFTRLIEQARQGRNKQKASTQPEDGEATKETEAQPEEKDQYAMQVDQPETAHLEPETDLPTGYHDATWIPTKVVQRDLIA
ncbi:unnamed protein product [Aureobasidium pullulans]|nr:unnamed protein product [Aureobasidium pullulans]